MVMSDVAHAIYLAGKAEHAPKAASCVDPNLYTCSGNFDDEKGIFIKTDLCTGDLDAFHCCEGVAVKKGPDANCMSPPNIAAFAFSTWLGVQGVVLLCMPHPSTIA